MSVFLLVLFGLALLVGLISSLMALLRPQLWWRIDRITWGWTMRGGRDAEPSEAGLAWLRIRGGVGVIAVLIGSLLLAGLASSAADSARKEDLRALRLQAQQAWSVSGAPTIAEPTGSPATGSATGRNVQRFDVVTDDGASPEYLHGLARSTVIGDYAERPAYDATATDLLVGTTTLCVVTSASAVETEHEITVSIGYAPQDTATMNRQGAPTVERSCEDAFESLNGKLQAVPFDLDQPVGTRTVLLDDGTELQRVR